MKLKNKNARLLGAFLLAIAFSPLTSFADSSIAAEQSHYYNCEAFCIQYGTKSDGLIIAKNSGWVGACASDSDPVKAQAAAAAKLIVRCGQSNALYQLGLQEQTPLNSLAAVLEVCHVVDKDEVDGCKDNFATGVNFKREDNGKPGAGR